MFSFTYTTQSQRKWYTVKNKCKSSVNHRDWCQWKPTIKRTSDVSGRKHISSAFLKRQNWFITPWNLVICTNLMSNKIIFEGWNVNKWIHKEFCFFHWWEVSSDSTFFFFEVMDPLVKSNRAVNAATCSLPSTVVYRWTWSLELYPSVFSPILLTKQQFSTRLHFIWALENTSVLVNHVNIWYKWLQSHVIHRKDWLKLSPSCYFK